MRILIAHPFGIGDVLFSLPLVHALRANDPTGFIGYLCNRRTEELVAGSFPVDCHFVFEKDEFRKEWRQSKRAGGLHLWRMLEQIKRPRFEVLLDLSLGWHYGLGALLAGIRKRIGFDFHSRGRFLTDRLPLSGFHDRPVSNYYLDLLAPLGMQRPEQPAHLLPLPESARPGVESALQTHRIFAGDRVIGIVPGGGASWGPRAVYKQWGAERFAHVADEMARRHHAKILIIGDIPEFGLCQTVAHRMSGPATLATQIRSLLTLAGILQRCELVIGNDGGTMHLAAAMDTRTLTIFGPVDGSVYGPLPGDSKHRIVAKGLACRPCYQEFRFPPCPWDNACLKQLETEQVISAADELLRDA